MGAGPDGLFSKAFKVLSSPVAPVLVRMFNLSFQTTKVPEDWRRVVVTPVTKTDPGQFRPIRLMSVDCKIPETILKEKQPSHFSKLSLLTIRHQGFLLRQSTVINLLSPEETVTRWLEEVDTVDIVYLDFGKAFDSVNRLLLLTMLKCYGIAPSVINWV